MAIVLLSLPVFIETQVTSRPTSPPSLTPTIPPKNGTSFSSKGHVILLFNLFFLILKNERNPSVLYTLTTPSFIVSHHRSILLLLSANPFKPTYNEREVTYLFFFLVRRISSSRVISMFRCIKVCAFLSGRMMMT